MRIGLIDVDGHNFPNLAIIAAITATGLIAGYAMQPWIVGYCVTLTAKNIVDYVGVCR